MTTSAEIAQQLQRWYEKWGLTGHRPIDQVAGLYELQRVNGLHPVETNEVRRNRELAHFRLRTWHRRARQDLEAMLASVGFQLPVGEAKRTTYERYPQIPPLMVEELRGLIHDLTTWGPRPDFRPEQTLENVLKLIRRFMRPDAVRRGGAPRPPLGPGHD